jgi:23S rRNA pseudouridine1911/1915/1917 synthase
MGDAVYGAGFKSSSRRLPEGAAKALENLDRQALHAMELGFVHPITKRALHFTSPRPADIEALYAGLRPAPRVLVPTPKRKPKANVSNR